MVRDTPAAAVLEAEPLAATLGDVVADWDTIPAQYEGHELPAQRTALVTVPRTFVLHSLTPPPMSAYDAGIGPFKQLLPSCTDAAVILDHELGSVPVNEFEYS